MVVLDKSGELSYGEYATCGCQGLTKSMQPLPVYKSVLWINQGKSFENMVYVFVQLDQIVKLAGKTRSIRFSVHLVVLL